MGPSNRSSETSSRRTSSGFGQLVSGAGAAAERASYEAQVNALLQKAVSDYSDRDVEAIRRHIDTLKKALESDIEGTIDLLFGGSTEKHTYVNGLSDVDLLARIDDPSLTSLSPRQLLRRFAARIQQRLPNTEVTPGRLAVTVHYSDGHEIQVLPALSTGGGGVRIARPSGDGWSNVIKPEAFARKLTEVNRRCAGRVVPTIKLFKAAQESMPENARLSGYHAESLAVQAFESYGGGRSYREMLMHLCRSAAEGAKTPVRDRTGQSVHVDDYMGGPGSEERQRSSRFLSRLVQRIEAADRQRRMSDWEDLFGGGRFG